MSFAGLLSGLTLYDVSWNEDLFNSDHTLRTLEELKESAAANHDFRCIRGIELRQKLQGSQRIQEIPLSDWTALAFIPENLYYRISVQKNPSDSTGSNELGQMLHHRRDERMFQKAKRKLKMSDVLKGSRSRLDDVQSESSAANQLKVSNQSIVIQASMLTGVTLVPAYGHLSRPQRGIAILFTVGLEKPTFCHLRHNSPNLWSSGRTLD